MKVASNFRVVVTVDDSSVMSRGPQEKERGLALHAEALRASIKRHCDGLNDIYIARDFVCSCCGSTWETDDKGEPVCCNAAQKEWAAVVPYRDM